MANKRQRKKQHKKQLQKQIVTAQPHAEVEGLSYNKLSSIVTQQEQQTQRKQKRRENLLKNRAKKFDALISKGFDPTGLTAKQIDKIKLKDLDTLKREDYPYLYPSHGFDFEKVYTMKDNERMYLAFRDFAGEHSLEEILSQYAHMSNEQLLSNLENLATMPQTYSRKNKTGSSGAAGDYKLMFASQEVISMFQTETKKQNRRKPKKQKQHSGGYSGYQVLKDGRRNSCSEVTPRGMLVVMNAIMSHVTEGDRVTFYNEMYSRLRYHMPDFAELLPKP